MKFLFFCINLAHGLQLPREYDQGNFLHFTRYLIIFRHKATTAPTLFFRVGNYESKPRCLGTLVSEKYVVTAASCLARKDSYSVTVLPEIKGMEVNCFIDFAKNSSFFYDFKGL